MRIIKSLSVAIAASAMIAAPVASAQAAQPGQVMTPAEAHAQMQRYCAETATRTDEAGRSWHATYCSPEAMARHTGVGVNPGAATVAGVGFMLAALLIGIITAD